MRIAQLSTPHERTPPTAYGSINRVVSGLTEELVRRGHDVTLYATGDSRTSARLRWLFDSPSDQFVDTGRDWLHSLHSLRVREHFDIVHNHNVYSGAALGFLADTDVFLTTSHFFSPADLDFYSHLPRQQLVAQSQAQRRMMGALDPVAVVPPGIDVTEYPLCREKDDYLLVLGQIGRHKGTVEAVQVARLVGRPLVLAGPVAPWNRQYFEQEVEPLLGPDVSYVGEVGGQRRLALLQRARCLLMPSNGEESFGLVLVEAMACGTPAVGTDHGAIPEVIEHGVSGFVASSVPELALVVERCGAISAAACRRRVERCFTLDRMTDAYLKLYRSLRAE